MLYNDMSRKEMEAKIYNRGGGKNTSKKYDNSSNINWEEYRKRADEDLINNGFSQYVNQKSSSSIEVDEGDDDLNEVYKSKKNKKSKRSNPTLDAYIKRQSKFSDLKKNEIEQKNITPETHLEDMSNITIETLVPFIIEIKKKLSNLSENNDKLLKENDVLKEKVRKLTKTQERYTDNDISEKINRLEEIVIELQPKPKRQYTKTDSYKKKNRFMTEEQKADSRKRAANRYYENKKKRLAEEKNTIELMNEIIKK